MTNIWIFSGEHPRERTGPFVVHDVNRSGKYELVDMDGKKRKRLITSSLLHLFENDDLLTIPVFKRFDMRNKLVCCFVFCRFTLIILFFFLQNEISLELKQGIKIEMELLADESEDIAADEAATDRESKRGRPRRYIPTTDNVYGQEQDAAVTPANLRLFIETRVA